MGRLIRVYDLYGLSEEEKGTPEGK